MKKTYLVTIVLTAEPEDVETFGLETESPVLEDGIACGNYEVKLVKEEGGEDP